MYMRETKACIVNTSNCLLLLNMAGTDCGTTNWMAFYMDTQLLETVTCQHACMLLKKYLIHKMGQNSYLGFRTG